MGEAIQGYYPQIITLAEFVRVQEGRASRKTQTGPRTNGVTNLFTGLLKEKRAGGSVVINTKEVGMPRLVSYAAMRGEGEYVSFPYRRFEDAFLEFLSQLTVEDVAPTSEPELNTALEEAEARKIDLDARIASMKKRVATDPNFESLARSLG